MTCQLCKYANRKKVFQGGFCMCENRHSENHKAVMQKDGECKKGKAGKFRKEYVVYLTK